MALALYKPLCPVYMNDSRVGGRRGDICTRRPSHCKEMLYLLSFICRTPSTNQHESSIMILLIDCNPFLSASISGELGETWRSDVLPVSYRRSHVSCGKFTRGRSHGGL